VGNGTIGVAGAVSAANSLWAAWATTRSALPASTPLTNGNYVVGKPSVGQCRRGDVGKWRDWHRWNGVGSQ